MSGLRVALIPARAGSRRLPGKNLRELVGHPLVAYAIATAREAALFDLVAVVSEDARTREVAERYGALPLAEPPDLAGDDAPDIGWVRFAVEELRAAHGEIAEFAILRPSSPFRRGSWVAQAWERFALSGADSLRAMRPVREHPGKMWRIVAGERALPLLPFAGERAPWHSMPTQLLPTVYVQTASLEIARVTVLRESISGGSVCPWLVPPDAPEAVDINDEQDWERAVALAHRYPAWLPAVIPLEGEDA